MADLIRLVNQVPRGSQVVAPANAAPRIVVAIDWPRKRPRRSDPRRSEFVVTQTQGAVLLASSILARTNQCPKFDVGGVIDAIVGFWCKCR